MKLKDVIQDIRIISINGNSSVNIESIQYDSRKVTQGSLFICVRGFNVDGHDFIEKAIEKGAVAFLVEEDIKIEGYTFTRVKDTRSVMAKIASNFYNKPSSKMNVIGVTGTNGKTSITTFLNEILKSTNENVGLIGTIKVNDGKKDIEANSTTPESVDLQKYFNNMINNNCKYCVMEVSSHSLALNRVDEVDFKIGLFTNLTPDHLDFHLNLEEYRQAKEKLFHKTSLGNIINIDDNGGKIIYEKIKKLKTPLYTYGIDNDADFRATNIKTDINGVSYHLITPTYEADIFVPVPGKFTVYNTLGVIAICYMLNIPREIIIKGLNNTKGVCGRFETVPNDKGISVIVDYAHTPDALENILNTTKDFAKSKIITVFGCGGDRDKSKRPAMGKIAQELSDICIITSDNPRTEEPRSIIEDILKGLDSNNNNYKIIIDRKKAITKAIELAKENDVVIIAGKGHENYQIIGKTKYHFDDKEIAKECLEN